MRSKVILLAVVVGLLAISAAALATPGIGVLSAVVQARGTIEDEASVRKAGMEILRMGFHNDSVDVVTQSISIAPGGSTGWHGHPGPVLVTIKSGALTVVYADDRTCDGTTYTAGQSFIDFGSTTVHNAFNRGTVPVDFWATYLVPGAPGAPFRIDAPNTSHCGV